MRLFKGILLVAMVLAAVLGGFLLKTFYDAGEFNDRPYFVMEHVEGRTLKEVIADDSFTVDEII